MGSAFTNFLSGVAKGFLDPDADLKDWAHADRLYVKNNYARAPKFGFLYFVNFNISPEAIKDASFRERKQRDVGLLVKKIDLPKFKIATETLNQYNRKTIIQTKISYDPVSIEFHDDNSDISTDLWKQYYSYYYKDGVYALVNDSKGKPMQYTDSKLGSNGYSYGYDNTPTVDFFQSIDIYVLHKGRGPQDFTQITLVNPKVTDWAHDNLDQSDSGKIQTNKMSVVYETVLYRAGKIIKNSQPEGFAPLYYDTAPSPLSVGGGIPGTLFGAGGVLAGASAIFGENGSLANARSPLDLLGVALQTKNLVKGASQLTKAGLKQEGYSILGGVLSGVRTAGQAGLAQPGGLANAAQVGLQQSGFGALGNIGVNLFTNKNSSINGKTLATPKTLTGPGG